ncbi:hypothetical protein C0431_15085, partial [bacterium]|nr:hypothetical protein [bacterium]
HQYLTISPNLFPKMNLQPLKNPLLLLRQLPPNMNLHSKILPLSRENLNESHLRLKGKMIAISRPKSCPRESGDWEGWPP